MGKKGRPHRIIAKARARVTVMERRLEMLKRRDRSRITLRDILGLPANATESQCKTELSKMGYRMQSGVDYRRQNGFLPAGL